MEIQQSKQLSEHFTWAEATITNTAFENRPNEEQVLAIEYAASKMEIVRQILDDEPINVNSWFRSPNVNKAVGGAKTSQHLKGEAVDFVCPRFGTPKDICKKLRLYAHILDFDQIILEPSWIHISFTVSNPRHQVLSYVSPGKYELGLI